MADHDTYASRAARGLDDAAPQGGGLRQGFDGDRSQGHGASFDDNDYRAGLAGS